MSNHKRLPTRKEQLVALRLSSTEALSLSSYQAGRQKGRAEALADFQHEQNRIFYEFTWPFFLAVNGLEHFLARFDQCVIDRGMGMMEQLKTIQTCLYERYSNVMASFPEQHKDGEWYYHIKRIVYERIAAYNRIIDGDKNAYDDLIRLAQEFSGGHSLIEVAQEFERGGRSKDEGLRWLLAQCQAMKAQYTWEGL